MDYINRRCADLLALINDYRILGGLAPLRIEQKLTTAAQWMVNDLATHTYLDHTDSWGRGLAQRLAKFGITNLSCGENIYRNFGSGTAKEVFNAWRKSPGHNALMLDPEFTSIGLAYALSKITTGFLFVSAVQYLDCWVAEFSSE